jgi:acetyl-CoA acetyltransferase
MKRAAIVSPIRTPVGKYLGALSDVTAGELGAVVLKALVERTGINPEKIDDVIFAQGYASGEAPCIARYSALAAGLPIEIPGYQLDRRCGSGLQAVIDAAMMVQTGVADVVIAGGVESMSNAEYYTTDMRKGARAGSVTMHDRLARGRQVFRLRDGGPRRRPGGADLRRRGLCRRPRDRTALPRRSHLPHLRRDQPDPAGGHRPRDPEARRVS